MRVYLQRESSMAEGSEQEGSKCENCRIFGQIVKTIGLYSVSSLPQGFCDVTHRGGIFIASPARPNLHQCRNMGAVRKAPPACECISKEKAAWEKEANKKGASAKSAHVRDESFVGFGIQRMAVTPSGARSPAQVSHEVSPQ